MGKWSVATMDRPKADQEDVLKMLRRTGSLAAADRIWDAIEAGEDLGEMVPADEVARRLAAICASKR